MGTGLQENSHRWGVDAAQSLRALRAANREQQSGLRLGRVFHEEDAALAARWGEDIMTGYRFRCRYCGSQFSLAQQCEDHEQVCATPEERAAPAPTPEKGAEAMTEGATAGKLLHCRRCGGAFPTLTALAAHVRADHADEFRAAASAGTRRRYEETRKIDRALMAEHSPAPAAPAGATSRAPAVHELLPHRPAAAGAAPPAHRPARVRAAPRVGASSHLWWPPWSGL
jgi:hypothetical protein